MDIFTTQEGVTGINTTREGVKIGIFNGLFALTLLYGSYYIGLDVFINQQYITSFFPYMIIVLLIAGFQLRKKNGGYLSFKEAIRFSFLSYVVAAVIIAIGTYILYNFIDKDLTAKSFALSVEKTRGFMERMGASDKEIEDTIGKLDEETKETGFKTIVLGTGMGLIWDFVKSLLISIIIRKEKPAFSQQ
jgi:hypothetical protein